EECLLDRPEPVAALRAELAPHVRLEIILDAVVLQQRVVHVHQKDDGTGQRRINHSLASSADLATDCGRISRSFPDERPLGPPQRLSGEGAVQTTTDTSGFGSPS